jgi:hypothetical protein
MDIRKISPFPTTKMMIDISDINVLYRYPSTRDCKKFKKTKSVVFGVAECQLEAVWNISLFQYRGGQQKTPQ